MKIFSNIFRLVKEIVSKDGIVHFRRWAIIERPTLRVYIHNILQSDHELHEHDHPWNMMSLILKGGYNETSLGKTTLARFGSVLVRHHYIPHKITLIKPTWSLVIAWGPRKDWGYSTDNGWIDNETYRKLKNAGALQK